MSKKILKGANICYKFTNVYKIENSFSDYFIEANMQHLYVNL